MKFKFIFTALIAFIAAVLIAMSSNSEENAAAFPDVLDLDQSTGQVIVRANEIEIVADHGTDLFTDASGARHASNVPSALFEPIGDVEMTARVRIDLEQPYSGAGYLIIADDSHWAKIIFERFKSGQNGVASTVVRDLGDDAYHGFVERNHVYLKLSRADGVYVILVSSDGDDWIYKRSFSLATDASTKIGFMAQSPIAEQTKAVFSEIKFVQSEDQATSPE